MSKDIDNKPSILKQVIRGILIASAIGICGITALSILTRHPRDRYSIVGTFTDLQVLAYAIERFEIDYARLPNAPGQNFEIEGPQAAKFINVLLGKENTGPDMENPRQIAFLTIRITKNKKRGGLVYSSANEVEGIYDAWGNPLRVILHPPGKKATTVFYRGKQVACNEPAVVLSRGADGKWDTEDDLMSASDKQ